MTFDNPKGGIGYAAEFQSSALPWVTSSTAPNAGSPIKFEFPKVTRFITVACLGSAGQSMSFGFTQRGVAISNNKFVLSASQTVTIETRIKQLWLQGESGNPSYNIFAGLTNIDASNMPVLTGTFDNGSPGWSGVG